MALAIFSPALNKSIKCIGDRIWIKIIGQPVPNFL